MKLSAVHIKNYRSVDDSLEFTIQRLNSLVAK